MRTVLASLTLAAALVASTAQAADGAPSALEAFKTSQETVVGLVHAKAPREKLQGEVDAFLDYEWIAQVALGDPRSYQKKCEPRCDEYEALLARLIRENYLRRLHQVDSGEIEYLGEEIRKNKAKVDTVVRFDKDGKAQELKISYVMHLVDGKWITRNIITDGVSLVKTYQFEFGKIIRDEGIGGLISRLETKLDEVAKAD